MTDKDQDEKLPQWHYMIKPWHDRMKQVRKSIMQQPTRSVMDEEQKKVLNDILKRFIREQELSAKMSQQSDVYEWNGGLCEMCGKNDMIMEIHKSDGTPVHNNVFICPCGYGRSQTDYDTIEDEDWEN